MRKTNLESREIDTNSKPDEYKTVNWKFSMSTKSGSKRNMRSSLVVWKGHFPECHLIKSKMSVLKRQRWLVTTVTPFFCRFPSLIYLPTPIQGYVNKCFCLPPDLNRVPHPKRLRTRYDRDLLIGNDTRRFLHMEGSICSQYGTPGRQVFGHSSWRMNYGCKSIQFPQSSELCP